MGMNKRTNGASSYRRPRDLDDAAREAERELDDVAGLVPSWRESDEALAYYVTTGRLEGSSAPKAVLRELKRIEEEAEADPALRRRLTGIRMRLDELANASDGEAALERLTGHHLTQGPGLRGLRAVPEALRREGARAARSQRVREATPRLVRKPARHLWGASRVVIAATLCYGLLALISLATRPPHQDLVLVPRDGTAVERALRLRGGESDAVAAQNLRYMYAHRLLADARRSTLGLFTRYDRDQVQEAIGLLREAVDHSLEDSPLWRLSLMLLARAHLATGDVDSARVTLLVLAERDGREAQEARVLLQRIEGG